MTAMVPAHERQLALLDQGKRLLAEARTIEAAKDIRDQAQAVEHYLRQRGDSEEAMLDAAELKLRAERRLGWMLANSDDFGRGKKSVTVANLGITHNQSKRWQRSASVPADRFEQHVAAAREQGELTTTGVLRLAKELQQPGKQDAPPMTTGCLVSDLQTLIDQGKRFGTVYADPPWNYSNQSTRASTDNHYKTMTVDEIAALPIRRLAAAYSHLHLWTTNAFLFDCPKIMDRWGFTYQGVFVWCKPQIGIGNCWRVSHEFLLLGIRGKPRKFAKDAHDLRSWAAIDRDAHSVKPEQVRLWIEDASPTARLELFGRRAIQGWVVWGNETEADLFRQAAETI
jgi:N6-adenosine-specific RNA methylase IME4